MKTRIKDPAVVHYFKVGNEWQAELTIFGDLRAAKGAFTEAVMSGTVVDLGDGLFESPDGETKVRLIAGGLDVDVPGPENFDSFPQGDALGLRLLDETVNSDQLVVLEYYPYPSSVPNPAVTWGEFPTDEVFKDRYQRIQRTLCRKSGAGPDNKLSFHCQWKGRDFWIGLKDWVVSRGASARHYDNLPPIAVKTR